jgi:peptidoglycan/LPS O-acetylase OafA/YrhL
MDTAAAATAPKTQDKGRDHRRIGDIEMLRGFAVIFVLIEHARLNLFTWIGGQTERLYVYFGLETGVDLFFAISGFVIARSLLPTLARTDSSLAYFNATLSFWVRRSWRLMPSAWLWLALILVGSAFFNRSGAWGSFRANYEGAVAATLDIANFRILHVFGRYEPGASFPYWSLSLEEQFYFLFPLIVLVSGRRLPWVLGIAVISQSFMVRSGVEASKLGLLLNQIRSDALLLGVLIAIWSQHPTFRLFEPTGLARQPALRVFILAFLLVALGAIGSDRLHIVSFPFGVAAVISAILVWLGSFDKDYLCPDILPKRLMVWIGSRSYALYLIHIPSYYMAREIWVRLAPPDTVFGPPYFWKFALTALVLMVIFVELNYRLVEVPLRRKGARIAERLSTRSVT